MDGVTAIRTYIDRLITGDGRCTGMKVLLLDTVTTQILSCVYSQTEILQKEVYLVSRIDDGNSNPHLQGSKTTATNSSQLHQTTDSPSSSIQQTSHLKAVCFLRPTEINAGLIVRELTSKCPRFSEYHLFFSGILPTPLLRLMAENDEFSRVKQVQEFYADFLPINDDLLTLNCRHTLAMSMSAGTAWARDHAQLYSRNREGLCAMLLSLKRQPCAIRFQRSSALARQLAEDVQEHIMSDQIFHFRRGKRGSGDLLLLVLDRNDDPVTPLLSQWTYQAMVHELLGLNNNRVVLRGAPNVSKELEEVVLSAQQDPFFRKNRHANFGELGEAIKTLLHDYERQTQSHSNIKQNLNSIEEMQQFMEKFPEIRSQSHHVSKHVAIMGELARLVDVCSLLDVSQFEQELACQDDHATHVRELVEKLASPHVKVPDKLRLGLLYALRYEESGNVEMIKNHMLRGGVSNDTIDLMDIILRYAGTKVRGPGLFGNRDVLSKMTKSFMTSVQGVSNVYSQHVPLVMDTIQSVIRGKLKESSHPYVVPLDAEFRPQEILVFMVGGTTYEEACKISEFNETNTYGVKVMLGGSTIHNSTSFLEELKML